MVMPYNNLVVTSLAAVVMTIAAQGGTSRPSPSPTTPAMHVSFDGSPVRMYLSSPFLVLVDPLTLCGLTPELLRLRSLPLTDRPAALTRLSTTLRIGVHEVQDFRAGTIELRPADLERAAGSGSDSRVVDVDSGSIVFVDLAYLPDVAAAFTWERYDRALRAPRDDFSAFTAMLPNPQRPAFALLSGTVGTAFAGDGTYRLKTRPGR
jgi:hypothetical protein